MAFAPLIAAFPLGLVGLVGAGVGAVVFTAVGGALGGQAMMHLWHHHHDHHDPHYKRDLENLMLSIPAKDFAALPAAAPHVYIDDLYSRLQDKGMNNTIVSIKHGGFCYYYSVFDDEAERQRQAVILSTRMATAIELVPQGHVAMRSPNGTTGKFEDMTIDQLSHFTDTVLGAKSVQFEDL